METEPTDGNGFGGWSSVWRSVFSLPARRDLKVWKSEVENPFLHGFQVSFGSPRGQLRDYRLTLSDCTCLHVVEFADHYLVHWDTVSPDCNLIEHARKDAPGYYVGGSTALGALVGALFSDEGQRSEGAAIGAFAGLLLGLLTL